MTSSVYSCQMPSSQPGPDAGPCQAVHPLTVSGGGAAVCIFRRCHLISTAWSHHICVVLKWRPLPSRQCALLPKAQSQTGDPTQMWSDIWKNKGETMCEAVPGLITQPRYYDTSFNNCMVVKVEGGCCSFREHRDP